MSNYYYEPSTVLISLICSSKSTQAMLFFRGLLSSGGVPLKENQNLVYLLMVKNNKDIHYFGLDSLEIPESFPPEDVAYYSTLIQLLAAVSLNFFSQAHFFFFNFSICSFVQFIFFSLPWADF
jgi:hypothetical protein